MSCYIQTLSLKVVKEKSSKYDVKKKLGSPDDVAKFIRVVDNISENSEESLIMLTLDVKNHVTGIFTVSTGSLNSSVVHPREVFKRALMSNSASIIIAHNHPSGDSKPSNEDIIITKRLKECGRILGVELLDHIIIGDEEFYSFKKEGEL